MGEFLSTMSDLFFASVGFFIGAMIAFSLEGYIKRIIKKKLRNHIAIGAGFLGLLSLFFMHSFKPEFLSILICTMFFGFGIGLVKNLEESN